MGGSLAEVACSLIRRAPTLHTLYHRFVVGVQQAEVLACEILLGALEVFVAELGVHAHVQLY